jgi:guanine deaminase
MSDDDALMNEAFDLARRGMEIGGGPFGAVVARDGITIAKGMNESRPRNDATAHAEILAIRAAGAALGRRELYDCILYSSCEPCPMCLAACYWAQIPLVTFACTAADAAAAGFDDASILAELCRQPSERKIRMTSTMRAKGLSIFKEWAARQLRVGSRT